MTSSQWQENFLPRCLYAKLHRRRELEAAHRDNSASRSGVDRSAASDALKRICQNDQHTKAFEKAFRTVLPKRFDHNPDDILGKIETTSCMLGRQPEIVEGRIASDVQPQATGSDNDYWMLTVSQWDSFLIDYRNNNDGRLTTEQGVEAFVECFMLDTDSVGLLTIDSTRKLMYNELTSIIFFDNRYAECPYTCAFANGGRSSATKIKQWFDKAFNKVRGKQVEEQFLLLKKRSNDHGEAITGLRHDVDGLRVDVDGLRADVDGLRVDVDGLRVDVDGLRVDMKDFRQSQDFRFGALIAVLVIVFGLLYFHIFSVEQRLSMRIDSILERLDEHNQRIDSILERLDEQNKRSVGWFLVL